MTDDTAMTAEQLSQVQPEMVGDGLTAPTMVVDGTSFLASSLHNTKITFVEHFPTPTGFKARPVVNLVIPNDQFLKILEVLNQIAEQHKASTQKTEVNDG